MIGSVLRPDGGQIAAPSIGFPFALNVIDSPADPNPTVRRMPSGENNDPAIETHAGLDAGSSEVAPPIRHHNHV
jgi:hypothetical protein